MIPEPTFWLAVFGLALTCLAAIGARSLVEFGPHELKEVCHRHGAPDRLGQILRRHGHVGLAAETLQVVATAVFVGTYCFWTWVEPHGVGPPNPVVVASSLAVGTLALLAAEIWIPWAVVRLWAEPFLYYTWPAWQLLYYVLLPPVTAAAAQK